MPARSGNRGYAFVLSVLGHAALVVGLTFSLPLSQPQRPGTGEEVVPIDTVMIGAEALEAELERVEAERVAEEQARLAAERAERAEQRRIEEEQAAAAAAAEQARIEREQAAAEAAAEAERIRLEAEAAAERRALEQERIAEEQRLEAQRRAEEEARQREAERIAAEEAERERRRREAEAAARAEAAAQVARAAEAEAAARQARESGLQDEWLAQISNLIERHWRRPPTAQAGIVCVLDVDWIRTGDVIGVNVVEAECNGDAATRRSIESAVLEASPLPQPPVSSLFDRNLRIRFAPD